MSSTRFLSENNEPNKNIIIKDVVPHSMSDKENYWCTCSKCPNISNWCIKDALGLACSILTWFLFIYAEFMIIFVILIPENYSLKFNLINLIIFHVLEFFAISAHCRTMFSNPVCVLSFN